MGRLQSALSVGLLAASATAALADDRCSQETAPIVTDRPSVTNSAVVVPVGTLQNENGINFSRPDGDQVFDGTNSRLRLGVATCLEVLVDLPNYTTGFRGIAPSGFGDVSPAVKWQISPNPGKVDVSITIGAALPTGAVSVAGPGAQPYLQVPWAVDLGSGWGISGMETNFFIPDSAVSQFANQSTFVLQKELSKKSFAFVEYVGNFPQHGGSAQLFNSGAGYRITDTQQIDFRLGFGLNHNAPAYIFGVGYSWRIDHLFK
jgi:Putative MetA-pathway of phenol degradation